MNLGLVDRYGRQARDLRVSLTDRCNLRCSYCMPAEGLDWLPREEVLTDDEAIRLISIAVNDLGVREVRFTGGEPLLRPGLERIVAATVALDPGVEVSLTTNGLTLADRAAGLRAAGLHRVNVSLDTLHPDRFRTITRRDRHADVLAGLAAATAAGLSPVKVNAVLLRGINDDEAPDLLDFCSAHGYELRFIEQMPLDAGHTWTREAMVTADEILERLHAHYRLTPADAPRGSAPAETWLVNGGPTRVGVVGSITRPFCAACDRTRLTADGQVRSCLFSNTETDLRTRLRGGAGNAEIASLWRTAMWGKPRGHGVDAPDFVQPERAMSAIGG